MNGSIHMEMSTLNICPKKAAVFIFLGQSNAVGRGLPMSNDDSEFNY